MKKQLEIYFDPERHAYYDSDGDVYISATTLLDLYKSKFDKERIAYYESLNRNIEVEEVIKEYDEATYIGIETGNSEHNFMETCFNVLNDSVVEYVEEGEASRSFDFLETAVAYDADTLINSDLCKYPHFYLYILEMILDGWTFYPEVRVFSKKYLISGTSDLIGIKDKEAIIIDYKTCKDELMFRSGYFKNLKYAGMKIKSSLFTETDAKYFAPLDNVQICKGKHYNLQVSIYGKLLELKGYRISQCFLLHLKPIFDKEDVIEMVYKSIEVPYLRKSVTKLFKHYNASRKTQTSTGIELLR